MSLSMPLSLSSFLEFKNEPLFVILCFLSECMFYSNLAAYFEDHIVVADIVNFKISPVTNEGRVLFVCVLPHGILYSYFTRLGYFF